MPRNRKAKVEEDETSASAPERKASGKKEPYSQKHHSFDPYPTSKVYRLIEPGPVLMVTTDSLADSTHNVMTIGFHMAMQHESPPLIGISLGPWHASFAALKKQHECVLAVPSIKMASVLSMSGITPKTTTKKANGSALAWRHYRPERSRRHWWEVPMSLRTSSVWSRTRRWSATIQCGF